MPFFGSVTSLCAVCKRFRGFFYKYAKPVRQTNLCIPKEFDTLRLGPGEASPRPSEELDYTKSPRQRFTWS